MILKHNCLGGGGLNREGGLIYFLLPEREGLLEGGLKREGGGEIQELRLPPHLRHRIEINQSPTLCRHL